MKFGDKLIQLRKKNGLSQEELAAKLNVSRQSVSKWESNNTYPETDKIVQICNIFDCTMDDLINENIKDITMVERKNKNQLNINIESFLDFVTKTINMFCSMKFLSGLKCLIELGLITGVLVVIGIIICGVVTSAVRSIFSFLPWEVLSIIKSIIGGIIELAWIIITIIAVVHVFKIRYLNYYEQIINEEKDKTSEENDEDIEKSVDEKKISHIEKKDKSKKEKIKFENSEPRVVIRDKEPFAFLNVLAKMTLWFIKSIAFLIGLFFAFILLLGVIGLVLCISLSIYSQIFVGLDIGIVGLLLAIVLILMILIHFILGTKIKTKLVIILFFISIVVTGVGIGIGLTSLKDITIEDDLTEIMEITTQEEKIEYKDNLIILDEFPRTYEYIIDNSLADSEIIIQNDYDQRFSKIYHYEENIHGMPVYSFYLDSRANFIDMYNIIINDLKNNVFRDYDTYLYRDDIRIIASEKTINKLIDNFSKIYVFEKTVTDTGYKITSISDRIRVTYSECYGEYNVLTGEIETTSSCKCIKEEDKTSGIIEYSCHYIYDEDDE